MAWRGRKTRVGRLDKTQKNKNGRSAFTLIEIMIVLAIVGLLAGMVVPRIFRYREPPAVRLQRTVEEASNLALSSAVGGQVQVLAGGEPVSGLSVPAVHAVRAAVVLHGLPRGGYTEGRGRGHCQLDLSPLHRLPVLHGILFLRV